MIADVLLGPALIGGVVIVLGFLHVVESIIDNRRIRETIGLTIATVQAHLEEGTTRNRGPATSRQTTPANTGKAST